MTGPFDALCRTGKYPQGLFVLGAGLLDDIRGQRRGRGVLVPVKRFQIIPQKLLIETGLGSSGAVLVLGPEAGRIGRQDLVDQDQLPS